MMRRHHASDMNGGAPGKRERVDRINDFFIPPTALIRDAAACIDRNARGIALVVDDESRLVGTVTDGDIRRAMLAGHGFDESVQTLRRHKAARYSAPLTAGVGASTEELLTLFAVAGIEHIPLLDADGRVADLVLRDDLTVADGGGSGQAVIMAGGLGLRLRPLTETVPKPMLPLGDKPLLERTINHLKKCGVRRISIATHYLAHRITEHFGDGGAFGVDLTYVREDEPLGTAGALRLLGAFEDTLLVINGDILTNVDFEAMRRFHRDHGAVLTVGLRKWSVTLPYGVVDCDGARVRSLREKPVLDHFVNAGVYLVEPSVRKVLPAATRFDMTDLVDALLRRGEIVVGFPIREYWRDIGRPEDYLKAREDVEAAEAEG